MEEIFSIRRADFDDINAIGFLAQQIWPETYGEILSPEQLKYMLDLFYNPDALSRQMQEDRHQFIIMEHEEEAIGFASWGPVEPGIAKLHKLYILPVGQGKGLGRGMLDFIYGILREEGISRLRLNVNRHNKAQRFYEKLGFKIIDREDIDIGNGYYMNDFIMEAVVPPGEYDDDI
jgi:ribosomal protein S18 acetylase RimI-like enzyme